MLSALAPMDLLGELSFAEKGVSSVKVILTGFLVVFAMLIFLIIIVKIYSLLVGKAQRSGLVIGKKKKFKRYEGGSRIQDYSELNVGDYVVHESHGLGIYRGIEQVTVDEPKPEAKPVVEDPYRPVTQPATSARKPDSAEVKDNQFLVKAGATLFLKPFAIAPGAGFGLLNLGGSPVGLEAGLYFGSLSEKTASLFGLDAAVNFRVGTSVYPKAVVGFFSCKSSVTGSGTSGLCAGAGLTFLVGGHFAVEAGLKYYPKVNVSGTTPVSTAGTTYDFPAAVEVLGGGIAPMVSIGWAF